MENGQSGGGNPRPDAEENLSSTGPAAPSGNGDREGAQPLIRPVAGAVARGEIRPGDSELPDNPAPPGDPDLPGEHQIPGYPEPTRDPGTGDPGIGDPELPAEPPEGDSSYPADADPEDTHQPIALDEDTDQPEPNSSLTSLAREASQEPPEDDSPADQPEPHDSHPVSGEYPPEHTAADTFHQSDYDYPYQYGESRSFHDDPPEAVQQALEPSSQPGGALTAPPAPPPAPPDEEEDEDDGNDGMLRMSFLDHLEELRSRIIKCLIGVAVAFGVAIFFSNELWKIVSQPAAEALQKLGYDNLTLIAIKPTEQFNVIWVKLPVLAAIFLASPWILYQVWAFIAPGLYKRERRWAVPFVIVSSALFILGGLFAYYVAFRFGLTFLLGIGRDINITPYVTIEEYFDLFVNVVLVTGLVFELPVLLFFLTLLHIVSPRFLIRNTRYAVLAIVVLAAVVTPTPDVLNLMMFSVPMLGLYFVGVFASYLLVMQRENRRFPWFKVAFVVGALVIAAVAAITLGIAFDYIRLIPNYPFLVR